MFHRKKLQKKSVPNALGTDSVNSIQLCAVCTGKKKVFSTAKNAGESIKRGISLCWRYRCAIDDTAN